MGLGNNIKKVLLVFGLLFLGACNVQDYNLRTIHDVDRNYVSADSTSLNMAWKTASWRDVNINLWSSAGVIITNEYNIFKQPYWLKMVVDNGFEGEIICEFDPQYINIDWITQPEGTFEGDFFNLAVENDNEHLLKDMDGAIIYDDPYYILDPAAFDDASFYASLKIIFNGVISNLDTYLGNPDNIKYGWVFPDYNWQVYGPSDKIDSSNTDPFLLGKALENYTSSDLENNVHPYQDKIIKAMNQNGDMIIIGDRLDHETPANSLLASRDINGVFFENVTSLSVLQLAGKVTSYRSAYTPITEADALMVIAGFKTDIYHAATPYSYAAAVKCCIDLGMYFTPGYDGTMYQNFPNQKLADWWLRSSDDSNWQEHGLNPTYASITVSPRRVISGEETLYIGYPMYANWYIKDEPLDAVIDYETIAKNDIGVLGIFAMDGLYKTQWANLVDNVRLINPDYVNFIYVSAVVTNPDWATGTIGKYTRDVYDMVDALDDKLYVGRSGTKPYGAYLRNVDGSISYGYPTDYTTTNLNPYAFNDGLADSLATYAVRYYNKLTNDREYTGIFVDFLNDHYGNWQCQSPGCNDMIDMDGDGIPYYDSSTGEYDTNEVTTNGYFSHEYLKTMRDKFLEFGMKNRLILCNGNFTYNNPEYSYLVDGTFIENVGLSQYNTDLNYKNVLSNASVYENSLINKRLYVIGSNPDSDDGKWKQVIALATQGQCLVQNTTVNSGGRYGNLGPWGLEDSEKVSNAGTFESYEYINNNNDDSDINGDVIHTTYSNLEAWLELETPGAIPFPYLILSTSGDTLSVGADWRKYPIQYNDDISCDASSQSLTIDATDPCVYSYAYGVGQVLSSITLGSYTEYSDYYLEDYSISLSETMVANDYIKISIMSKDVAGNITTEEYNCQYVIADTTPPILSNVTAMCDGSGTVQSVFATVDEPVFYKTRFGVASGPLKILYSDWTSYTSTLVSGISSVVSNVPSTANYYWGVEIQAKDVAGNESLIYGSNFQWSLLGDCPP